MKEVILVGDQRAMGIDEDALKMDGRNGKYRNGKRGGCDGGERMPVGKVEVFFSWRASGQWERTKSQ